MQEKAQLRAKLLHLVTSLDKLADLLKKQMYDPIYSPVEQSTRQIIREEIIKIIKEVK